MTSEQTAATDQDPASTLARSVAARLAEAELDADVAKASEREWRELIETLPQIVWITRPDGYHVHFNKQWLSFTGLTLEESLGDGWNPPFHPEDRPVARRRWAEATSTGKPYQIEYRLRRHDGVYHWMLGRALPLRNERGEIVKWFGTCTDIEDLKEAQASVERQARLLDQTHDAIVVHDLEHRILYWNKGSERIHGWTAAEAVGRRLDELIAPDLAQVEHALNDLLDQGEWQGELHYVTSGGDPLVLEGRWTLLRNGDGTPRGALAVNTDVTDRRKIEARLLHALEVKATHDSLTGLPNRELLLRRLQEALDRPEGRDGGTILLLCDLDDFKIVNDALGHDAGDQVLVEVARRMRSGVRDGDLVSRLGGDEFAILLRDADEATIDVLTTRLIETVSVPVELNGAQPVQVGLSIGVARSSVHHDARTLLRDADATMYHAKHQGKGRAARFDDQLHLDVLERLALPQELRAAFGGDALFCQYQPEIDIATGKLFAVEALARWQHPERGLLAPSRFVQLAETAGLADQLFAHVLGRALRDQRRWEAHLGAPAAVSVNVSASQLDDPSLPDAVTRALDGAAVPPDRLWLEVTETAVADVDSFSTLTALRQLGVRIAIDDFGTGWSSLNRLFNFPFDLLKIDRSFVAGLGTETRAEHMVRATISMAHAMGMRTVAEGVENDHQLETLAGLGCDLAQGFLFARPLDVDTLVAGVTEDGTFTRQH
jgi:diguanylate cyclase (GGDEF)-like protein/PAS domain S-box-containing protein